MQVPLLIAPGLTLGAALSNSTRERPLASLPVTTRRIGLIPSGAAPADVASDFASDMGFLPGSAPVCIAQRSASGGPNGWTRARLGDPVADRDLRRNGAAGAGARAGRGFSRPPGQDR